MSEASENEPILETSVILVPQILKTVLQHALMFMVVVNLYPKQAECPLSLLEVDGRDDKDHWLRAISEELSILTLN